MKDSFLKRVGRIISGNAHSLMDLVEGANVEAVFEETIREIESVIDEVRNELGKLIAQKHLNSKSLKEMELKHSNLNSKIEFAVKEDREDLAKAGIKSQLELEAQIPILKNTIAELEAQIKDYDGYIVALKAKRSEMQSEFEKLADGLEKSGASFRNSKVKSSKKHSVQGKVDKATGAFDRLYEKQTKVCKSNGYDLNNEVKLSELEALEKSSQINERLETFKSRAL